MWLTSDSPRRAGIVTLTDLSATLAVAAGASDADFDGAPLQGGPDRRMSTGVRGGTTLASETPSLRSVLDILCLLPSVVF